MRRKYQVLRFYIGLLKILSVVVIVGGPLLWIYIGVQLDRAAQLVVPPVVADPLLQLAGVNVSAYVDQSRTAVFGLVVWRIVLSVIGGVGLWAAADFLQAHIDTEENTRAALFGRDEPQPQRSIHGMWDEN